MIQNSCKVIHISPLVALDTVYHGCIVVLYRYDIIIIRHNKMIHTIDGKPTKNVRIKPLTKKSYKQVKFDNKQKDVTKRLLKALSK